jgi:hypothetical protein
VDAEILTRRGWKAYDQLIEGDETPGFNFDTLKTEWTAILAVNTLPAADIIEARSHSWSVRSTAGHRWVARDSRTGGHYWVTTAGVRSGPDAPSGHFGRLQDSWVVAAPLADGPGVPVSADEAELLGWLMTDGSQWGATARCAFDGCEAYARAQGLCGSHRRQQRAGKPLQPLRRHPHRAAAESSLFIWQSKPKGQRRLRILLGGKAGFNGKGFRLHDAYARDLLGRAELTHIKDATQLLALIYAMTDPQRAAMLAGVIGGDGTAAGTNSAGRIMQNEGPLLDVITTLAYCCGYRATVGKHKCSARCWEHTGVPMIVNLGQPRVTTYRQGRLVVGHAPVSCPTTALGTWTAKFGHNPVLTGSSHEHDGPAQARQTPGLGAAAPPMTAEQADRQGRLFTYLPPAEPKEDGSG